LREKNNAKVVEILLKRLDEVVLPIPAPEKRALAAILV